MSDELLGNTGIRWSAESIGKAEDLVYAEKVKRDPQHGDVFWVEGSEKYRVQTDGEEWITCTCPNGQARSRPNCYHTAAALILIRDEREARSQDVAYEQAESEHPNVIEVDFSKVPEQ